MSLKFKTGQIKVELLDTMGSDLAVVNAARVSFNKESAWEGEQHWTGAIMDKKLSAKDAKLISYLAQHNHWSPFAHCTLQFRISAPIFVARQLAKHQVGFAWNEVSRRYVDYQPTFWLPDSFRSRAENVKQGSSDTPAEYGKWFYAVVIERCVEEYNKMLESGVCPEQARAILPQATFTEWIWTGSLYGFSRVCHLRLEKTAQAETAEVAQQIAKHCEEKFPVCWKELMNNG